MNIDHSDCASLLGFCECDQCQSISQAEDFAEQYMWKTMVTEVGPWKVGRIFQNEACIGYHIQKANEVYFVTTPKIENRDANLYYQNLKIKGFDVEKMGIGDFIVFVRDGVARNIDPIFVMAIEYVVRDENNNRLDFRRK